MGIIGDSFGKLFGFIGDLFGGLFGVIWNVITWIGELIKSLFQGLVDILIGFFQVIYDLIASLLHLLYMIGVVAVKLFTVIFEAAQILWSLIVGFGRTLASLNYTPTATGGHAYSEMIGKVFNILNVMQLDSVAYILLFVLWFSTAISAMKLISSIRVGGS